MPLSLSVTALRRPAGWLVRLLGRTALALVVGAWLLGLGVWLTLHGWILPRLGDWRPRSQALASRALGQPVQIGRMALSGTLGLALDGGPFLQADAGAARLLGVLSLQALQHRLRLDFRDVFDERIAFDTLTADLHSQHGVARTDKPRLRGLQATVLMDGSADIAHETQNLRAVALPGLNTARASLAYAAINPAVAGAGAACAARP